MSIYALPALLALIAKISLVVWARSTGHVQRAWLIYVLVFSIHNSIEFLVFVELGSNVNPEWLVRAYYTCVMAILVYGLIYITEDLNSPWVAISRWTTYSIAVVLACLTMATDFIVAGSVEFLNAVTAVRGSFYPFFQLFVIFSCLLTGFFAVLNWKQAETEARKNSAMAKLMGLGVLVVSTVIISTLMLLEANFNAISVTPIASTLFLFITYIGAHSDQGRTDLRTYVPGTKESDFSKKLKQIRSDYSLRKIDHKQAMEQIELVLIEYKYKSSDENASEAARSMGVPRPTLYTKAQRLGLPIKKVK